MAGEDLNASMGLDLRNFKVGLRLAADSVKTFASNFKRSMGEVTRELRQVDNGLNKTKGHMKDLERIVGGIVLAQGFYGMKSAIEDAAGALVTFMNDMERAQIALEYFLATPDQASAFLMQMNDFAATTAFNTQQALTLSRKLMAAQFDPNDIKGVMTILNDASSATGGTPEQMDRIVLALTQIKTNGKLAGQEMRQLAEAGIPIYKILQEQLGLTGEELMRVGELGIKGDDAVNAILVGLQQRYEGAAERIANTVPGMWQTIVDDSKLIGNTLFRAPYEAMEKFLRKWRDLWEEARNLMTRGGLGRVLEQMFPPEVHTAIRLIAGSVKSLGRSFLTLAEALKPVAATFAGGFVNALGIIMPVLAGVARAIANLTKVAMEVVPGLKYLLAAILALLVAQTVSKVMLFFWNVLRLGTVAAAVAKSVVGLAKAIALLSKTVLRSPAGIIMIVAASLLYMSGAADLLIGNLDKLMGKLGDLAGFDVNKELQDMDIEFADIDEFDAAIGNSEKNFEDAVDGMEDKAKKFKKFLASFDEVFQVPEDEDDKNPLGGLKVPDFNIDPFKWEELDFSDLEDDFNWEWPDWDIEWPEFIWPEFRWPKFEWPEFPPWNWPPFSFEFAWPALPTWNWPPLPEWEWPKPDWEWNPFPELEPIPLPEWEWPKLPQWEWPALPQWEWEPIPIPAWDPIPLPEWEWPTLPDWEWPEWEWPMIDVPTPAFEPVLTPIRTWAAESLVDLAHMMQSLEVAWDVGWAAVGTTISGSFSSVGEWFSTGWNSAIQELGGAMSGFGEWFATGWNTAIDTAWTEIKEGFSAFGTWLGEHWQEILMGIIGGLAAIAVGALAVAALPFEAAAGAITLVGAAIATAVSGAILLLAPFWDEIKAGLSGAWDAVVTWAKDVGNTIAEWTTGALDTINQWAEDTSEAITLWVSDTWSSFTTWVSDVASEISGWVTDTINSISTWTVDTAQIIADWISDTVASLTGWVSETAQAIAGWISETVASFSGWSSELISTFTTATQEALQIISDWVSRGIKAVVGFVTDFGSEVGKIPGKLWDAIEGLPKSFADLIGQLPGKIPTVVSAIAKEFGKLPGAIWEAIKSIPSKVGSILGEIKLPSFITGENGITAQFKKIGKIAGFARGGIIDKDSIVRVGEAGRREAIIPLENPGAMQPFAEAVARHLQGSMTPQPGTYQGGGNQQILYVGTLIADDRSLRELERKMNVIRLNENARGVR